MVTLPFMIEVFSVFSHIHTSSHLAQEWRSRAQTRRQAARARNPSIAPLSNHVNDSSQPTRSTLDWLENATKHGLKTDSPRLCNSSAQTRQDDSTGVAKSSADAGRGDVLTKLRCPPALRCTTATAGKRSSPSRGSRLTLGL